MIRKKLLLFLLLFMPCLCVSNNTPEEMNASTLQESEYGASRDSEYMNPDNELDVMSSHSSEENESELKNSKKERIAKKKNSNLLVDGAVVLVGGGALFGLGVLAKCAIWDKKNKGKPTGMPADTGIGGHNLEVPPPLNVPPLVQPPTYQEVITKSFLRLFDDSTPDEKMCPTGMFNSALAVSWGYDNNWPNVHSCEDGTVQIQFTPYSNMWRMGNDRERLDQDVLQNLTNAIIYTITHHKHILVITKANSTVDTPTHNMLAWYYLCKKLHELFFTDLSAHTALAQQVKDENIQIKLFFEPFFNDASAPIFEAIWTDPSIMVTFGINDNNLDKNAILRDIGVWLNEINDFLSDAQRANAWAATPYGQYIEPLLLR